MNRIVREQYPVERLPSDLRESMDPARPATVTVEQPTIVQSGPDSLGRAYAELVGAFRATRERLETERRGRPLERLADLGGRLRRIHGDEKDVVDHIRAMRDQE